MSLRWCDAQSRAGTIVLDSEGGDHVVTDGQGKSAVLPDGWSPIRALIVDDSFIVVLFEHVGGKFSGWLLTSRHEFIADVASVGGSPGHEEIRSEISRIFLAELARLLTGQSDLIAAQPPLRPGETWVIGRLLSCLDARVVCTTHQLAEFTDHRTLSTADLFGAAQVFSDFMHGIVAPTRVPDGLTSNASVTDIRHIPLEHTLQETAHLCWTKESNCPFVIFLSKKRRQVYSFVFAPERQAVFGDDLSEGSLGHFNNALTGLFLTMMSSGAKPAGGSYKCIGECGLVLSGKQHLAHAIWDDLQAVERALQLESQWPKPPFIFVRKGSGAALYGPLEDCYPEFKTRFIHEETVRQLVGHALGIGAQLFRPEGRRAMRTTRDRMIRVAREHGEARNLARQAAFTNLLERRPVVVFGLRLTNRHPQDPMGFYVRLTEALVKKFGQLSLIFDGMNVDPSTGRQAARVFNASGVRPGDTRSEVEVELDFVRQFQEAVAHLPVQIYSCVGLSIRDNLFWLSHADFFVAPNGAGLAKLRWALDIPGYVLTSRINFTYCYLLDLYGDKKETEEPFTPIYMNAPEEVEDVPVDPPRTEPLRRRLVPYPENFIVMEELVIPRICSLVEASIARGADSASGTIMHQAGS